MGLDRVDHRRHLGDTGDVHVGGGIEAFAAGRQVTDRADRVASRDQRPDVGRSAQPLGEHLGSTVEPDRDPAAVQRPAVARVDDGTAARRDDAPDDRFRIGRAEVLHGVPLEPSERGLPILGEDRRDLPAVGPLDALVEVDEGRAVAVGQPLADHALAAPRQTDHDDIHRQPSLVVAAGAGLVRPRQPVASLDRLVARSTGTSEPAGDRCVERTSDP